MGGKPYPFFSYSGPGPQQPIAGTMNEWYFGTLSDEELFSSRELSEKLGYYPDNPTVAVHGWRKFHVDGKVLFVAKKPVGRFPKDLHTEIDALSGNRVITLDGYRYKVRVLNSRGPNALPAEDGYDLPFTHGSEWNRLMYNSSRDNPATSLYKKSQVGLNWNNLTSSDFGLNTTAYEYTMPNEIDDIYLLRGNDAGTTAYAKISRVTGASNYYWRPVLELVIE